MKKFNKLLALILAMLLVSAFQCTVFAELSVSDTLTKETFTDSSGTEMLYRRYVPDNYSADKKYSFLLFLHGAGNRGNDNEKQIAENMGMISRIINGETVEYDGKTVDLSNEFIIIVPQCPQDAQWVDTPWGKSPDPSYDLDEIDQSKSMTAVIELIESMKNTYNIDTDRLYVTGLSMGGFGTWDLLMRYPDMFAAAIPMGGAGDPEKAGIIKDIPIWTFHQLLDTVVLSQGTQNMVSALVENGANIKFTPYFDLQHNAWTKGYAEPDLLQWLYSYTKTTASQNTHVLTGASDWAKHELGLAYATGLMPDCILYNYQDSITREDFCEAAVTMIPSSIQGNRVPAFTDTVNASVNRAYSLGIVNGVSDTEFLPEKYITREEICAMLERAFKLISSGDEFVGSTTVSYLDEAQISDWAKDSVAFMSNANIILGDESKNINPKGNTTREQAAALIYRTFCVAYSYDSTHASK